MLYGAGMGVLGAHREDCIETPTLQSFCLFLLPEHNPERSPGERERERERERMASTTGSHETASCYDTPAALQSNG